MPLDDVLAHFPSRAYSKVNRNALVTVEGKVVEIYADQQGAGKTLHLVMVGTKQGDEDPAHVSCVLGAAAEKQIAGKTPGFQARVTGRWGALDPADNRVNLDECSEVVIEPAEKPRAGREMPLVGRWSGVMPSSPPMPMTITLRPDQTAEADFEIQGKLGGLPGKWSRKNATTASLTLEHADGPVDLEVLDDEGRVLSVPSIPPLYFLEGIPWVKFQLGYGIIENIDFKTPGDQALAWLNSHAAPRAGATLAGIVSKDIQASTRDRAGWSVITGASILAGGKTTQLCMMNGQEFSFEYTDAEARAAAVPPGNIRAAELTLHYTLLKPEVVIDSIQLDHGTALVTGQRVSGKISLHSTRSRLPKAYRMIMEDGKAVWLASLNWQPSLDTRTFAFSFPAKPAEGEPAGTNPKPVFFSLSRDDGGLETPFRVSKTVAFLMDGDQP